MPAKTDDPHFTMSPIAARSIHELALAEELGDEVTEPISLTRLTRDLLHAEGLPSRDEVRFLVDTYYSMQTYRISSNNRAKAMKKLEKPHAWVQYFRDQQFALESDVKKVLDRYSKEEPTGMGLWARSNVGIGPVIAAGLAAWVDVSIQAAVSNLWSFAGLNPDMVWEKGQKRPFAVGLKVLSWKIGASIVFTCNKKDSWYGPIYKKRKQQEIAINDRGDNAVLAAKILKEKRWNPTTIAYQAYKSGKLPDAHIHARASRWVSKLFLAHYWEEAYRRHYGVEPPKPYPVTYLEHVHIIPPDPKTRKI